MSTTRVDLHNHTTLCNHATGTVDEYIQKAIELGIDEYGFACHAPMNYDLKYRMKLEERAIYEKWVNEAKEKYKDKIKVLLAYEVDYLEGFMLKEILQADVDYLISSVHFLRNKNSFWGFDNPEFIGVYKNKDIDLIWQEYFNAIRDMAKTNHFDIVGHLDLIKIFKFLPKQDIRLIAKEALQAIKKANMVIEVNSAGFKKPIAEAYPSKELLQEAFDLGINITFSSDAHNVEDIGLAYEKVVALAKDIGYSKCMSFEKRDRKLIDF